MERLIEAERGWRAQLDAARTEAERMIAAAKAAAEQAARSLDAELEGAREQRRRELETTLLADLAAIETRNRAELAAFAGVTEEAVHRLATTIARQAPWLASPTPAKEQP